MAEDEQLERILICRKYLLQAGSDLDTIVQPGEPTALAGNIVDMTFKCGVPVRNLLLIVSLKS